jgi:hypothetical protein
VDVEGLEASDMERTRARWRGRAVVAAVAAAVLSLGIVGAPAQAPAAQALSAVDFDPGYIISDENFFAPGSMSIAEIQAFLVARVPTCAAGATCLKSYTETTRTIPATPMCTTYTGAANETAATIIWKVAQACGISPKVILVTLQKEQGLVNSTAPSSRSYRSAMGAGCPDTADCDSNYYGFFNQVHYGAYLMKRYTHPPGTGPGTEYTTRFDLMYPVGQVSAIQYKPGTNCGAPGVNIRNQATHVLYVYTPYQPNSAALANLNGTGDACSSYGNRNFWVFYNLWFGPPTASYPFGDVNSVTGGPGTFTLRGWAIDRETTGPITVDIYRDGRFAGSLRADQPRTDVEAAYPDSGPNHGFSGTLSAAPGAHTICVYGINFGLGEHRLIECQRVTVLGVNPMSALEKMTVSAGAASFKGWAFDPNTTNPISVDVWVNGAWSRSISANVDRPDVQALYPTQGSSHGFTGTAPLRLGNNQVCLYAINVGAGAHQLIGCRTLNVVLNNPRGDINSFTVSGTTASLRGWAFDADTTDPISVDVWVNGSWSQSVRADGARADVQAAYPGQGPNHGFRASVALRPGVNQICLYGINVAGGSHTLIGCRTATVAAHNPIGDVNGVTVSGTTANVRGWAWDADTANPITVDVWRNGVFAGSILADQARPDVATAYPAAGPNRGFAGSIPLDAGSNQLCFYGINVGGGAHTLLGCRTVTAG